MNKKIYLIIFSLAAITFCSYSAEWKQCSGKKGEFCTVALDQIKPTQYGVGYYQIKTYKIPKLKEQTKGTPSDLESLNDALKKYLTKSKNLLPAVYGYDKNYYIVDHHHLAYSIWKFYENKLGKAKFDPSRIPVYLNVIHNYSNDGLNAKAFWEKMKSNNYWYPFYYDKKQKRYQVYKYTNLPASIGDLQNDPYRSAVGLAQKTGDFADPPKDKLYFYQFKWSMCINQLGFDQPADEENHLDTEIIENTAEYLLDNADKMMNQCIGPGYIDMPKPTKYN